MVNKKKERKPIIGVTFGREGEYLRLKYQYPPAIINAGGMPVLIPYGNDPSSVAETIDGFLIPGGGDIDPVYFSEKQYPVAKPVSRERTDFEIALLKNIMKIKKPVFGICYGMQLINVVFGGSLYNDIGSQFGGTIDHTRGEHRIVGHGNLINGEFIVNSSHHQAVKRLGKGLAVCAVSGDDLVEAISLNDYPFLCGFQWHPERSDSDLSRNLFSAFIESAYARK